MTRRRSRHSALFVVATIVAVIGVAIAVAVGWVHVGTILNQRQPDLGVYYYVGELGDLLYSGNVVKPFMPEGGLPFTYTPFAGVLFHAMALIPFPLLVVVWASANVVATMLVVRLAADGRSRGWQAITLAMTLLSAIMAAHIMMGQLNALLLLLIIADFVPEHRAPWRRFIPRGVGTAVATAVKLTPVIFIAYLFLTRQCRAATTAVLATLGCFAIGALVYPRSTAAFFEQLPALADRVDVLGYFDTVNNTSISGMLAQLGLVPPTLVIGALTCALGLAAAVYVRPLSETSAAILLALVPSLATPVTWLHHWVALPIALCLAVHLAHSAAHRIALACLLATQLLGSVYVAYLDLPAGFEPVAGAFALSPILCALGVFITLVAAASRSGRRRTG